MLKFEKDSKGVLDWLRRKLIRFDVSMVSADCGQDSKNSGKRL